VQVYNDLDHMRMDILPSMGVHCPISWAATAGRCTRWSKKPAPLRTVAHFLGRNRGALHPGPDNEDGGRAKCERRNSWEIRLPLARRGLAELILMLFGSFSPDLADFSAAYDDVVIGLERVKLVRGSPIGTLVVLPGSA
jgi:hypothetical protein